MRKGLLIIYSGPSGVGKGTILSRLMADERLKLCFSISMTTRNPRPGEQDGVNYFFVSREQFMEAVKKGEMLEYAEFVSNCYGTPRAYVDKKRDEGLNVLLEIEVQGAMQVMEKVEDALSIFIAPPSVDDLRKRLETRGTEDAQTIARRIEQAQRELAFKDKYEYVVVNDEVERAAQEITNIILSKMNEA